jgi:hypothetical protein
MFKKIGKEKTDLRKDLYFIATIVGFSLGIFFLSPNVTGYAVSNLNNGANNLIGVLSLVIGLFASTILLIKRKE